MVISPPVAPASDRNKHPIAGELKHLLPGPSSVFEIGSGWGQHAVHFCREMPWLAWQPSERGPELGSLQARIDLEGSAGILPAIELDVNSGRWPGRRYDAVFTANTTHIMYWSEVEKMVAGVESILEPGGLFLVYGPFNENGHYTSAGNRAFDADLRERNPGMGIRDREALESLAAGHQMYLEKRIQMPANNLLLAFRQKGQSN